MPTRSSTTWLRESDGLQVTACCLIVAVTFVTVPIWACRLLRETFESPSAPSAPPAESWTTDDDQALQAYVDSLRLKPAPYDWDVDGL